MAAKLSTAAEKALHRIQEQVTCGICLEPYTRPKLLNCFHVLCEKCIQSLVSGGRQSVACPQCRQDTALPVGGVPELQGAFYIHYLFDIKDTLQKVTSSDHPICNKCKKREAVRFCRTCGFVCQRCVEIHQEWDDLATHDIVDLDTLTGNVTTLVPALKKPLFCTKHPAKEADLYCDQCEELICRDCIVRVHRDHQYDLAHELFVKHEREILTHLRPVEEQIATLTRAIESLDARCTAVAEQKTAVVAEIQTAITHLQQALKVRKNELVGQAEQMAQQKLKNLAAQRDEFIMQIAQQRSCQDVVEESRRSCSQGEILRMKSPLVKQIDELTGSFKQKTLMLVEQPDLTFRHNLQELMKTYQQFGEVCYDRVCPEEYKVSDEGVEVAMRGQTVSLCVEVPNITAPAKIIRDLNGPWGVAVREGWVVITECDSHCISKISSDGSFGTYGLAHGQFSGPAGIAIDDGGNILVVDCGNHRIQQLSFTGKHLKTVGTSANSGGPLTFQCPTGITVHPHTHKVYVTDTGSHKIQVLNSDLTSVR